MALFSRTTQNGDNDTNTQPVLNADSGASRRTRGRPRTALTENSGVATDTPPALTVECQASDTAAEVNVAEEKQVRVQVTIPASLAAKVRADAASLKLPLSTYVATALEASLGKVKVQVG